MAGPNPHLLHILLARIDTALAVHGPGLLIVGLCGAQGSGKSTLAAALVAELGANGLPAATLSLDDIYLTRAERQQLASSIHPLLATRGVPGTHDVALGLQTIAALKRGEAVALPRFDKGLDDRAPQASWPRAPAQCRVLLLEGWCVGAVPQATAALASPINALEEREDAQGIWRSYANSALAGPYRDLFCAIDLLILLAAPGWDVVAQWREEQELPLRRARAAQAMDPAALASFIQHYERLTRWILEEMPQRADVVVQLDRQRGVAAGA
ncbi:MAG: kinase [Novosphingobium sp.]|uniref:kinase n=1 Tax=Novosphingobium sp. TaxID=1874826 RepID=UPI003C7BB329